MEDIDNNIYNDKYGARSTAIMYSNRLDWHNPNFQKQKKKI